MGQAASNPQEDLIVKKLEGHTKPITSVAFSPDNAVLATCSEDTDIILWDCTTGAKIRALTSHKKAITCCSFYDELLATGCADGVVLIWKYISGTRASRIVVHSGAVTCCAFSPDGRALASSSRDKTVRLFDIKPGQGEFVPGESMKILRAHRRSVNCVQFNKPDGDRLASSSSDHTIRIWDRLSGTCLWTFDPMSSKVYDIRYSSSNPFLAAVTEEYIALFNVDNKSIKCTFEEKTKKNIQCIGFTVNGELLVAGCRDNSLAIYSTRFHKQQPQILFAHHSKGVQACAFSQDGNLAATGGGDNVGILWKVPSIPGPPPSPLPTRGQQFLYQPQLQTGQQQQQQQQLNAPGHLV